MKSKIIRKKKNTQKTLNTFLQPPEPKSIPNPNPNPNPDPEPNSKTVGLINDIPDQSIPKQEEKKTSRPKKGKKVVLVPPVSFDPFGNLSAEDKCSYADDSNIKKKEDKTFDSIKYIPTSSRDIVGNVKGIETIRQWIDDYKERIFGTKKALLLVGPPGIGKTTAAKLLLDEAGYNVIEFNASDTRNKESIKNTITKIYNNKSILNFLNNKPVISAIIMDECDGMSIGDKGGMAELISIINPLKGRIGVKKLEKDKQQKRWRIPIICIANNSYSSNLSELKKECLIVKFTCPTESELSSYLSRILREEDMKLGTTVISQLVEASQGDIRKLNSLITLIYHEEKLTIEKTIKLKKLTIKDKDSELFDIAQKLLNNHKTISCDERFDLFNKECSMVPLLIQENYIDYIPKKPLTIMSDVSDSISMSDVVNHQIFEGQHWNLYDTYGLFSSIYPSYQCITKYGSRPLQFCSILNKSSTTNNRNIIVKNLLKRMGFKGTELDVLHHFQSKILYYIQKENLEIIAKLLKQYHLTPTDLDDIFKTKISFNTTLSTKQSPKSLIKTTIKTQLRKIYERMYET